MCILDHDTIPTRDEFRRQCEAAHARVIKTMTDAQLLAYADRSDAVTRELCDRLEAHKDYMIAARDAKCPGR